LSSCFQLAVVSLRKNTNKYYNAPLLAALLSRRNFDLVGMELSPKQNICCLPFQISPSKYCNQMMSLEGLMKCIVLDPALHKCRSLVTLLTDVIEEARRIARAF
jgi:hypothetical protein